MNLIPDNKYETWSAPLVKKGYSGTAILSKVLAAVHFFIITSFCLFFWLDSAIKGDQGNRQGAV